MTIKIQLCVRRYGDDLTFYSIAPKTPSTPIPKMMAISKKEKKSALPMPLILDNSIDSYLENEDDDFILSDNSLLEEKGSLEKRGEKQYVLPVLHHRPKIRFSITI